MALDSNNKTSSKDYPFADEKQKNNWLWEFVRAELGADIAGWLYQRVPEALEKLRKRIKPPTIGLDRDFLLRQHQEARIKHQREQVTQTDNNLLKAAKAVLDMFEPANKHSPVPLLWLDDAVREAGKAAPADNQPPKDWKEWLELAESDIKRWQDLARGKLPGLLSEWMNRDQGVPEDPEVERLLGIILKHWNGKPLRCDHCETEVSRPDRNKDG